MKSYIKFLFVLVFTVSAIHSSYAQNESNFWYFGSAAALDFSGANPVAVAGSAMSTSEGCASISDKTTGQLLFYTDGLTIYNRNNIQMPNGSGLLGDGSSTQSAIIVPNPASSNLFYVFTVAAQAAGGLTYSVVDMTLQGGLGDVNGTKNVQLIDTTTEKVTAVMHCNGHDIWVISHKYSSNAYYSYLITNAGIQAPVITNIGVYIGVQGGFGGHEETIGYLKASPNGKKIASANWVNINKMEIFDFNNSTGVLSNVITDSYPPNNFDGPYGVCFSPDNSKVYFGIFPDRIFQYDLNAGSPAAILASKYTVVQNAALTIGGLGLAKNGKIYISTSNLSTLDVINTPNVVGVGCGYQATAVNLGAGMAIFGLPTFIESFFDNTASLLGNDTSVCSNNYTLDAGAGWSGYLWSNNAISQSIQVTKTGTYWVEVTNASGCQKRDSVFITLNAPEFKLPADTSFCGTSLTLKANSPSDKYLWNTGDTTESISITKSGSYSVTLTKGLCVVSDTIKIEVLTKAPQFAPPNIFTPNGDNTNDTYNIGAANFNEYTFKIFNRWGQLVFETTDTKVNWDGKSKGKDVPAGSYYWILSGNTVCGNDKTVIEEKGFVTLVR